MAIELVDRLYSTRNHPSGNNFPLANTGQFVTDRVDIVIDYDFESSMQNQILIIDPFTIQVLNGDFGQLGFSVGNVLELSGIILNGGSNIEYDQDVYTVTDVQGDLMMFDTSLELVPPQPPQNTSSVVGQLMPAPNGSTSNTTLLIVNTSIDTPSSIEVFHNLVLNSSQGSDSSLFDGEVNRFRAVGVSGLGVGGSVVMSQLGDKSGGSYKSVTLERLADVNGKRSYFVEFVYANPYKFEDADFDEPSQYSGSSSLKAYYRFLAFPVSNNPNSFIEATFSNQQGNFGWYNESYNQGVNEFEVTSLTITTVGLVTLDEVDFSQPSIITAVLSGPSAFLEKVEGEIYLIPPTDLVKNNPNSNADNISLSNFFLDFTGAPVIETDVFGNANRQIPTSNQSGSLGVDEITVSFQVDPTAEFTQFIDSLNDNERDYRITLNVESSGGTANENNSVSVVLKEGLLEKAPIVGGDYDDLRSQIFYNHKNDIAGAGAVTYDGNPEDDVLYYAKWDFEKGDLWDRAIVDIRLTRDSDGEFFTFFEQPIPFAPYVTTNDGVIQIDYLQQIQQYLDGPNRNKIQVNLTGTETIDKYEVQLIFSIMINWRYWLEQSNAFVDFFDNTLPNNGLNQEYVRYFELLGYTLSVEVTLVDGNNTAFRFGSSIALTDYDDTPDVTTTVIYYDEDNNPSTELIQGQTMRIEATHVNNIGAWNQDDTWGWISERPFETEPNKRISTVWDWTMQDLPLRPLPGFTKAKISYPVANTAVVECLIDTNLTLSGTSSIIAKIDDAK